jgi:hypothetical protein
MTLFKVYEYDCKNDKKLRMISEIFINSLFNHLI